MYMGNPRSKIADTVMESVNIVTITPYSDGSNILAKSSMTMNEKILSAMFSSRTYLLAETIAVYLLKKFFNI